MRYFLGGGGHVVGSMLMCCVFQHSPLRIGAEGTHVVGFLSKGLLRKAKPLVIFPGCGTRIEAIGLMFLGAKKKKLLKVK